MTRWPLWRWERRTQELEEELEAHLRLAIEDRVTLGEPPAAARAAALREMGNVPLVAEVTRQQWGWAGCERWAHDLRYALRQLRKSPGYAATSILTLTLAIGANTAIFGLLYAILLRSLPVERPDQIVQVELQLRGASGVAQEPSAMISDKVYDSLAERQQVFSGMCSWATWPLNLRESEGTRPIPSATLTGGCFRMLGLHAALGRLFTAADDRPGGAPEGYPIVLGYDYWRTHLGADPNVLGRVMDLGTFLASSSKRGVVAGVLEPGFDSVRVGDRPWIYVPSEMNDPLSSHNFGSYDHTLLARLKDGVSPPQAQAQVDAIFNARIQAEKFQYYVSDSGTFGTANQAHLLLVPGRTGYSYMRKGFARPLYLLEGMVVLSLLVACAYLAMLAYARAWARRRELAVRVALGASRARVAMQLCYESVVVAAVGGSLGVLFAWAAERGVLLLIPYAAGDTPAISTDPGSAALLFTLALSVFTVLLSGLWPAWRASRVDPASEIKEGDHLLTGRRRTGLGPWLVPVQIGFSLVIVVMAALMASTLARLMAVNPGFRTGGVTFFDANFSSRAAHMKMPAALDIALLDRIRHAPGVEAASMSQTTQFGGGMYVQPAASISPAGAVRKDEDITSLSVMPGYFETLGIPLLAGRGFTLNDQGDAPPVCILNRSAADYFFPGGRAAGSMLTLEAMGKPSSVQVVAVVGDTLYSDLREAPPRIVYQPYLGRGQFNPLAKVAVRARDTAAAVTAVRTAFRELAPEVALGKPETMKELVGATVSRERLVAVLASFFALLTLTLTAVGLYGLLSYAVVQRHREIGVRMALGASRAHVARLILLDAIRLVVPGLILGAAGAWGATRLLRTLLFGVKPLDPLMCAASLALLLAAAVASCVLPARRAACVHPMEALRFE
jgi:predicted permease